MDRVVTGCTRWRTVWMKLQMTTRVVGSLGLWDVSVSRIITSWWKSLRRRRIFIPANLWFVWRVSNRLMMIPFLPSNEPLVTIQKGTFEQIMAMITKDVVSKTGSVIWSSAANWTAKLSFIIGINVWDINRWWPFITPSFSWNRSTSHGARRWFALTYCKKSIRSSWSKTWWWWESKWTKRRRESERKWGCCGGGKWSWCKSRV